jgi:hypothetical protein
MTRQFSTGAGSFDPVCSRQQLSCPPLLCQVPTKSSMCRRIRIQCIDTYYLIVGAGCQVFAVRREADCVDSARVVAYSCELLWFRVVGVCRVEDGFSGPYANVSICQKSINTVFHRGALRMSSAALSERTSGCRNETRSIGRDVTAVNFKVFEIAC